MPYGPNEFANAFRTVRKNTIQVAEDIPESSYGFSAAADTRTVGQMLAHIAVSTRIFEELNKTPRITTLGWLRLPRAPRPHRRGRSQTPHQV